MIYAASIEVFERPGAAPRTLADLVYNKPVTLGGSITQKTGLTPTRVYKLTGNDYTASDRAPQGVATYGNSILVSFYYKYAPLQNGCKLVAIDRTLNAATNIGIVRRGSNGFERINTHAGGIEVFGDYLYVEDSFTQSIHVFDLRVIYGKSDLAYNSADTLFNEFDYLLPEVGRIWLSWGGQTITNTGYLSRCGDSLVTGNFWMAASGYSAGGKSMVWRLPMESGDYPFPAPVIGAVAEQFDPLFPANAGAESGLSLDKIQGALLRPNNVLITSRSYGSGTKQLTILTPNPAVYYNGNSTYPTGYDWKNWLYGCEDLSLTEDGNEVVTVTEFNGAREVSFWRLNDLLGLVGGFQPPTIAEHEAALALLVGEIEAKQQEAAYYELQINSAVAQNLPRFDRLTFVP